MRVAIIHYWLFHMRGGEKVLRALCEMYPQADIFTHVYDPDGVDDVIRAHKVTTSFIARLPAARRLYKHYLPLMPYALEQLDLTGYDLILSSEAGPAKGIIPGPDARHVCYCHSPMRYIWDQYHPYRDNAGLLARAAMPLIAHKLRIWDVTSAARVDRFVANSNHVANRITRFWRREAEVVFPPVAVQDFAPVPREEQGDYYLLAGELVRYKRPDIAVEAFSRMKRKLLVIGGGEERGSLEKSAGDSVQFLGKVPFAELKHHFARCRGLVFPGEEDFGIIPVEVMASGRPVIAYAKGGALDTIRDRETGLLFEEQSVEGLIAAVEAFEREGLDRPDPAALTAHAAQFDEDTFRRGMRAVIDTL
ncbi:glycosyltransferase family 4 protein (plasmid) [Paroceanicella profunda]|uniref:Glycosyltransferase family 4 protein n=1 Tax=Paroceanicella profunda TaxID=2579971 RepID=A0A5B8G5T3_9RHOB|nr:glycosyltransferase [Paroceanicella profunda]QDL94732.1 glycosyltransferase family 4 protein [Paroceanicella profunda]